MAALGLLTALVGIALALQQRDVKEAFMADVWDGTRTLYQALKASGFRALLPEKTPA